MGLSETGGRARRREVVQRLDAPEKMGVLLELSDSDDSQASQPASQTGSGGALEIISAG